MEGATGIQEARVEGRELDIWRNTMQADSNPYPSTARILPTTYAGK
jgi:hypothetical protein